MIVVDSVWVGGEWGDSARAAERSRDVITTTLGARLPAAAPSSPQLSPTWSRDSFVRKAGNELNRGGTET